MAAPETTVADVIAPYLARLPGAAPMILNLESTIEEREALLGGYLPVIEDLGELAPLIASKHHFDVGLR